MIELVEKVNVQLSPDKTWYGIYRFHQIPNLEDADKFIEELRKLAEGNKYEVSDKVSLRSAGEDWTLVMTFKYMTALSEAEEFMEALKKAARSHRTKGQKALDE